jgi:hypothetical protein
VVGEWDSASNNYTLAETWNGSKWVEDTTAHLLFLLEVLHGRRGTVAPLAFGDPRSEDYGQLLAGGFRCPVINGHLDQVRSPQIRTDHVV